MKSNYTLSTGHIVSHRPYLSNGKPNGATEAYLLCGGEMTDLEWEEYCSAMHATMTENARKGKSNHA